MRTRADFKKDVAVGAMFGGAFLFLCTFFVVIRVIGGGTAAFRERVGAGPLATLGVYLAGAGLATLVIAILRPLRKTIAGTCFIGFWAFLPLSLGFGALLMPREEWYPVGLVLSLIMAVLYGIGVGIVLFRKSKGWTE